MFAIVHGLSSVSISIIGMVSQNMTGNLHFFPGKGGEDGEC
jgi:hypothetical protein